MVLTQNLEEEHVHERRTQNIADVLETCRVAERDAHAPVDELEGNAHRHEDVGREWRMRGRRRGVVVGAAARAPTRGIHAAFLEIPEEIGTLGTENAKAHVMGCPLPVVPRRGTRG